MDIRQSDNWGKYLSAIGWEVEKLGPNQQAFIRPLPFLKRSLIKIQHPRNPLPFSKIDTLAKKHRALFVEIEPEGQNFIEEEFVSNRYRRSTMFLTHTATTYLNLQQSEKDLWASFSENARRNIRKAQNYNLEVRIVPLKEEQDDTEFRKFFKLFTNLTKLKKFYDPGYVEFQKRMLAFKKNSVIIFAYQNEVADPIAAVWISFLPETAIYMNTGITEEGYKALANYLLVWEALKLAQKSNLNLFDFEGLYDPRFPKHKKSWKKFSEFKKRFHGEIIEYPPPFIKFYSRAFKLLYLCSKIFGQ